MCNSLDVFVTNKPAVICLDTPCFLMSTADLTHFAGLCFYGVHLCTQRPHLFSTSHMHTVLLDPSLQICPTS